MQGLRGHCGCQERGLNRHLRLRVLLCGRCCFVISCHRAALVGLICSGIFGWTPCRASRVWTDWEGFGLGYVGPLVGGCSKGGDGLRQGVEGVVTQVSKKDRSVVCMLVGH